MGATDFFIRTLASAIKPDARIGIAEWAAKHRILPPDSPEPGRWRNERTPYLVGIMDALTGRPSSVTRRSHDDTSLFSNSHIRWVGLQKGHQLGGSALGENFIGHSITSAAGNILAVFATKDDAEKWEMDRFESMRTSTPELRRRVRDSGKKGSDNTKLRKKFPGGMLNLVSASRAGRLKSTTVRYVLLEEIDEYLLNVDGQGNPITLAGNRTSNHGKRAKIFANSTPTVKGRSQIEMLYLRGDQRRYFVPCPDCGAPQYFSWGRLRWEEGKPETAVYHCEACGVGNAEHLWKAGYDQAYWMPTAAGDGETASFHLSAMYAPIGWRPWCDAARDWINASAKLAAGDPADMIAFVNNFLADCWEDRSAQVKWKEIQQRQEAYKLKQIPNGCLLLTCAVDVQPGRLEVFTDGWGRGMENWTIDVQVIHGDPSTPAPWAELDKILETPLRNSFGIDMKIQVTGIDSGGANTQEVYDYCRLRQHMGVFALKGASERRKPIIGRPSQQDVTVSGTTFKNGVLLWPIGTDTAKERIFAALNADAAADRVGLRMHFPADLGDEFYQQLVAEIYNPVKDRWEKIRQRNEVLDCKVYNLACAYHPRLRINVMTEREWAYLESVLEPRVADLFSQPLPTEGVSQAEPAAEPAHDEQRDESRDTYSAQGGGWIQPQSNWMGR
ncbi:phage terminase large subunit GpA-like protein [Herbaspirillum seropedicae]|uniref:phage terminase large subunit family protein n=1 Tax=Herbaspirillum seropedicae TaxID=964 RepID=UPI003394414C